MWGGVSALSVERLVCMSASSDTNYASAGRMRLNVPPSFAPPPPESIRSQIYLYLITGNGMLFLPNALIVKWGN